MKELSDRLDNIHQIMDRIQFSIQNKDYKFDNLSTNLRSLFSSNHELCNENLSPYVDLLEYIQFGFEENIDNVATIRKFESFNYLTNSLNFDRGIRIETSQSFRSAWFSLELDIPVEPFDRNMLFGWHASSNIEYKSTIFVRYIDKNGEKKDIHIGMLSLNTDSRLSTISARIPYISEKKCTLIIMLPNSPSAEVKIEFATLKLSGAVK